VRELLEHVFSRTLQKNTDVQEDLNQRAERSQVR